MSPPTVTGLPTGEDSNRSAAGHSHTVLSHTLAASVLQCTFEERSALSRDSRYRMADGPTPAATDQGVGTPDHTHAVITLAALRSKKQRLLRKTADR
jgi:hypothetical protein